MTEREIKELLSRVGQGICSVEEAMATLKGFPAEMLASAHLDHHRRMRTGMPEVVYGENKTGDQLADILRRMLSRSGSVMATRVSREKGEAICRELPGLVYHPAARMLSMDFPEIEASARDENELVLVVSAGTSDIPVAEEASVTLRCLGCAVGNCYDVGVAGIHRLLGQKDILERAAVLVVVAGMEGALPSVIGGLVDKPLIAVPTSVGYGTGLRGIAALLGMLNSCVPGVAVVNIDNGFGAACAAAAIVRQLARHSP